MNIAIIGMGVMGTALKDYLSRSNSVVCYDFEKYASTNVVEADYVFICVKPSDVKNALAKVKGKVVVSIAAGISLTQLGSESHCKKIIRFMTNYSLTVGHLVGCYACNSSINLKEKEGFAELFKSGLVLESSEDKFDLLTAVIGSGVGFFAKIVADFISAAEKQGLNSDIAKKYVIETFFGSLKLLDAHSPEEIISKVATKGGITEAGIAVLDSKRLSECFIDVLRASEQKSFDLRNKF